jgi:hypothetical protein
MSTPPEISSEQSKKAYLQAVFKATGVWQMEVSRMSAKHCNEHVAKMWPLTFTEAQQEAIMLQFVILRLEAT